MGTTTTVVGVVMPRAKKTNGYRSKLEDNVAKILDSLGIAFEYEPYKVEYWHPVRNGICYCCEKTDVYQIRDYTPDFWLPDYGFHLEVKGNFKPRDRTKHLAIKESLGVDFEIAFVFQRDNWLTKAHKHQYSDWCEMNEFDWCLYPNLESLGIGE